MSANTKHVLYALVCTLNGQSFIPTGSMNEPRFSHAATLLNDGKVLVTGGLGASNSSKTAELYDPQSRSWTYTKGTMIAARQSHNAVKMLDGRVLIFGGHVHAPFTPVLVAEIYDPNTETFAATGSMSHLHLEQPAVLLDDGRVMLVGASVGFFGSRPSEIYDPGTGTWSSSVPLIPVGVSQNTGTKLPSGRILVLGGGDGYTGTTYPFAQSYSPASNTVAPMANLIGSRQDHSATLLPSGKLLVAGGTNSSFSLDTAEVYDPTVLPNGQSISTSPMSERRRGLRAALIPSGEVLVMGGMQGAPGGPLVSVSATAELWSPTTGQWAPAGQMSISRMAHTATTLQDGSVLVAGGGPQFDRASTSADLWGAAIPVIVDIKPGSYPNSINLGSGGTVPVAILSTATFDARTVDPPTITVASAPVRLKGQGTSMSSIEDVNADGLPDLVVHVTTSALQLAETETTALVEGKTYSGQRIRGTDTVRVVAN